MRMGMNEPLRPASTDLRHMMVQSAAIVLTISLVTILGALYFEHGLGYAPCELCLKQRWAYYAAVPLSVMALVLASVGKSQHQRVAGAVLAVIGIAFVLNAGLGFYHAGVEWKWWEGPTSCGGGASAASNMEDFFKALETTRVVRCDEAAWRFAGLSLAGWNVLISLVISFASLRAVWRFKKG